MDYLDFELEIQLGSGRDYAVAVLGSPAGEARAVMHFPFDQLALESRLDKLQIALLRSGGKRRSVSSPEEQTVQDFGKALFDALFTGEIRSRYDVSCERAAQGEQGLRLKLRIQDPQLAALPWEFLYDPQQAEYVCLSRNTPVVRYLELPQRIRSLKVTPPLRILGMIANPCDLAPLDVAREKARVEQAVAGLCARGLVTVTWLEGQTWRDLQRETQGGPWHIFHFVGHGGFDDGKDEGFVCLTGEDGRARPLGATQLGRLLADHRSLRLVLLNACEGARGSERDVFSSSASILVRRGIPAVLAMQYEITDGAAIEFAQAFYEALSRGLPVDAGVAEARKAVSLEVANTVEWGTPVLYMRTPDGVLFDLIPAPADTRPSSSTLGLARRSFFVSYSKADKPWAEWIAWVLENAGYSTFIQAWDFRPGSNFVLEMQEATSRTERTIAVLSPDYLTPRFAAPEWAAAFADDPTGKNRKLVPVRVRQCSPQGLLGPIVWIDLVGLDMAEAEQALLSGVMAGGTRPVSAPVFPGVKAAVPPLTTLAKAYPGKYHSCFISYAEEDQAFAEQLHTDLQHEGVASWFEPADARIGDKRRESLEAEIEKHDKLLVVLSSASIDSDWVETAVLKAFDLENRSRRTVLFPIQLDCSLQRTRRAWAAQIRRARWTGDFTGWKERGTYETALRRLLKDLESHRCAAGSK